VAFALCGAALAACSGGSKPNETAPEGDAKQGSALYAKLCSSCHGNAAEGGLGPRLVPWSKGYEQLVETIETTMPKGQVGKCDHDCAANIATYLTSLGPDCGGAHALPQRLRLLTRREYRETVRDLFQTSATSACQKDTDCDLAHQSCTGGACTADPCNLRTFVYDAGNASPGAVVVAGSFNGWATTAAAGAWPMEKAPGTTKWFVKHALDAGSYEYKFVLDGTTWIADPTNPDHAGPNGNSALTVSCDMPGGGSGSGGFPSDPTKDFPAESRPSGFPFDDSDSALVTSVHVDQYWKAASLLADAATADLANLLPCDMNVDADACAAEFVTDFGKRAFRRPLSDAEIQKYKALITGAPDKPSGVKIALRTMLSSPLFLYRSEIGQPLGDGTFRLTPYETAAALSYTFWGTLPDDALFAAAEDGSLATPDGIEKQARRLLADPRARAIFETFALEWLGIEKVATAPKEASLYPQWNDALAASMLEETRRFVSHVAFDGSHHYDDLLLADYTFADATLAAFYGTSAPASGFAQVPSPDNRRAGLLGQGSILSAYSYSDQSSPIRRGLFVRRNLLCQEFPAPPANAATVPKVDPNATTRERFDQHSSDPVCHSCHQYIDHVGFGFESFDAIGHHRDTDNGHPIDASGDMNDVEGLGTGTHAPFDSLRGLAEKLAASKSAKACFAKQTYRFAMGRLETAEDACSLSSLSTAFEQSGGDIQELWVQLTKLDSFTRRK
jgi:hypothetical protein